jgi:RNA polymerase sigma factor (sigma-70 family)
MSDDLELLREYLERESDEAFQLLVGRHAGMVHGVALRFLGNDLLAQEVTRAVFILLARKAGRVSNQTVLAGWLYRTARLVAREARRAEMRRHERHQTFVEMNVSPDTASVWSRVTPLLDDAMGRLRADERNAIVLRFFEEKSFTDLASTLGISEAAAKMRVGRGLQKLRSIFFRQGVVVPVTVLSATLLAHGASAPPTAIASAVSSALAGAESTSSSTLARAALKVMFWANVQKMAAFVGLMLALTTGAWLFVQQYSGWGSSSARVSDLRPMAGTWEGTYETRSAPMEKPVVEPILLVIGLSPDGRGCEIEMRRSNGPDEPDYRFTHWLNVDGSKIITIDDPKIRRFQGEARVTKSSFDPKTQSWRIVFKSETPAGSTECEWLQQREKLEISRHEEFFGGPNRTHLYARLQLIRRPDHSPNAGR